MLEFPPDLDGPLRNLPLLLAQGTADVSAAGGSESAAAVSLTPVISIIALVCATYWLIQAGMVRGRTWLGSGIAVGLIALFSAGCLVPTDFASYITFAFFALAASGAIGFLSSREPVYAALGFTTAVLSICGILFMQSALFVAAATMIVYAGATIIIFLFVLMFAQQTEPQPHDVRLNQPALAAILGGVVMAVIAICVMQPGVIPERRPDPTRLLSEAGLVLPTASDSAAAGEGPGDRGASDGEVAGDEETVDDAAVEGAAVGQGARVAGGESEPVYPLATAELGRSLYTDYLAMVELAGVLLLVAAVGAIALATRTTPEVDG